MDETRVGHAQLTLGIVRAALAVLVVAWLAVLFFQHGQPWDEAEHAHTAWLISRGERPLTDFFQHHQPLLWSLLALYFRVGLRGPAVLIWGRVLVVVAGLLSVVALVRFGYESEGARRRLGAWLGVVAFMTMTVLISRLFVIRPETVSAPLFLTALWLWSKPAALRRDTATAALAGVLAGAAAYSSPRFVLLAGFFVLVGAQTLRRWLALALGGLAFVLAYTLASGFSLRDVLFNLRYSALLQHVGAGVRGPSVQYWATLVCVACIPLAALLLAVQPRSRWRGAALLINSVVVFVLCEYIAGLFRYAQAFAPFVTAVAATASWIGGRLRWPSDGYGVLGVIAACTFVIAGLSPNYFPLLERIPRLDFIKEVRYRDWLESSVPAGATVLLYARDSPITVADASYYGIPLVDGRNRLCTAIREFRSRYGSRPTLPSCNFMRVLLQAKPYLTEEDIGRMTPSADAKQADAYVERRYQLLSVPRRLRPDHTLTIMVRSRGRKHGAGAEANEKTR